MSTCFMVMNEAHGSVRGFASYERAVGYVADRTGKPYDAVWEDAQTSVGLVDDTGICWWIVETPCA